MKKPYLFFAFLLAVSVHAQAPRKILVERFTNASCGPCAAFGPAYERLLDTYGDRIVQLNFHCSFPGVDPLNAQNPTEVSGRYNAFYPAVPTQGIPYCAMDGNKYTGHIANLTAAALSGRLDVASPVELRIEHSIVGNYDSVEFAVVLHNVSPNPIPGAATNLYLALTEKEIVFKTPPGTNGEKHFRAVMRKMVPSVSGTPLATDLMPGETRNFTFKQVIPTYIYHYGRIGAVVWLQNRTTKEVYQSAESQPLGLMGDYGDLDISFMTDHRHNLCDNVVTLDIQLTNNSSIETPITEIKLVPFFGSNARPKLTWTGLLEKGQTTTYKVSNFTLPNGRQTLTIVIDSINKGTVKDFNRRNNTTDALQFIVIPATARDTNINQTFGVNPGVVPAKTYVDVTPPMRIFTVTKANAGNPPDETGGFGQSPASMFIDLNSPPPGLTSYIYFDKVNLTNIQDVALEFSWAHARADEFVDNALVFEVSTDCGLTWEKVVDKKGEELASTDNQDPSRFFIPLASQWKKEKFDLSAFNGAPELLLRAAITTGGGQSLFLDDVRIFRSPKVSVADENQVNVFGVSPNPASDRVTIQVQLSLAADVNLSLIDLFGRKILQSRYPNLQAGAHQLEVSLPNDMAPGTYIVNVQTAKGATTAKLNVH